jgi:hypothetical protein
VLLLFDAHLVIMSTGEIDFSDFMYDDATTAYYKQMSYIMLVLLAITMTILVTNLLIGNDEFLLKLN